MKSKDEVALNELFNEMIDNISYIKRMTIIKCIKK